MKSFKKIKTKINKRLSKRQSSILKDEGREQVMRAAGLKPPCLSWASSVLSGTNSKVATQYSVIEMVYTFYADDIQEVQSSEISFSIQHGTNAKNTTVFFLKEKNTKTLLNTEMEEGNLEIISNGIF